MDLPASIKLMHGSGIMDNAKPSLALLFYETIEFSGGEDSCIKGPSVISDKLDNGILYLQSVGVLRFWI